MKIGLIGRGAIARYVEEKLKAEGHPVTAYLLRPQRVDEMRAAHCTQTGDGPAFVSSVADLPADLDRVVDCAGHHALHEYGTAILRAGFDLTTVSLGALADPALEEDLRHAAIEGGAALSLASGAIGALDALRSARIGELKSVRYVGRKPPEGWRGSPAEDQLDLAALTDTPATHFAGTARGAARAYPKNANVAAAVALAGIGFDRTEAELIADPTATANIHEIHAEGTFGQLEFRISGKPLPGNPRSSALAAMSVVDTILQSASPIRF
ncbi:aspartate dehydrogenase [Cribrihabitans sp. XS_ASV171]|uniref:L-aspartate dehydrogenase n=1 Tax=Pukyongiella litopenaei TaxID=2605946 RepID=A0A5C2H683_9RHOB|nr:aspartate dehydrogenase [Pukyongiella litopenaei]QEP30462.1 aspartate dehydrogenase [Pukyongiella litopenaei]